MEFHGPANYFLGKKKKKKKKRKRKRKKGKTENKIKRCPQGTNERVGLVADDSCGFQKT